MLCWKPAGAAALRSGQLPGWNENCGLQIPEGKFMRYIYIYIHLFLCDLCNLRCLRATIVLQPWHWASSYIVARLSGRQGVAMVPWLAKSGWLVAVKLPRPMADSWRLGRMWIHCHHIAVVFAPLKRSSMVLLSCRSCRFWPKVDGKQEEWPCV